MRFSRHGRKFRYIFLLCIGIGVLGVARRAPTILEAFSHPPDGICCAALFSPHDEVTKTLLELIATEERSIQIAAYVLTDATIAAALIKARQRGVKVEIVVDATALGDKYRSMALRNIRKALPLYVCHVDNGIMHNKFVIFGRNVRKLPIVWTGSFNFSYSAQRTNYENVLIISHQRIVQSYELFFEQLKQQSCLLLPRRRLNDIDDLTEQQLCNCTVK